jgi:competence ComEA-like helix-hairpin-helix protein
MNKRPPLRELRSLLWLLPLLALASWLFWQASKPSAAPVAGVEGEVPSYSKSSAATGSPSVEAWRSKADGEVSFTPEPRLFLFDPNTVTYHDLLRLGFERGEALAIVKFRERGKVFEIPEDFAACYQVSESMYRRLEPYIRIGGEFRLRRFSRAQGVAPKPAGAQASLHFKDGWPSSSATAEAADSLKTTSHHSLLPPLLDLNTSDSAALVSVSGIGPLTARRIIEYRVRLGGFFCVEQLAEVRGVTEQNYERILPQIFVDPAVIQKISINFVPAKSLASHPYIRAESLRKLLKIRQLKGGWRTPEELTADDIFTPEEIERLRPYLVFN